jgi:hypothetical protein
MASKGRRVLDRILCSSLLVPLPLSVLTLWRLFEMDLFWALRAGKEVVSTGSIPMTETWSYTVAGSPWLNTHWLTEVVLYLAFAAGGYPALVVLRAALVATWLWLVQRAASSAGGAAGPIAITASARVVCALAFVAGTYRMELRAEMFVLLAFAAVVALWASPAVKHRERWSALLVLAAANFHAGQAIMVLALALAMIGWAHVRTPRRAVPWAAACTAAFFVSPVNVRVVEFIRSHFFYVSELTNPDHQPLTARLFDPARGGHGLSYWAWGALTGLALAAVTWRILKKTGSLLDPGGGDGRPGAYAHWAPALAVFAVLTWLCFDRVRGVPFAVTFAAPLAGRWLRRIDDTAVQRGAATAAGLALACVHAALLHRAFGFAVDDRVFPVGAAAFVARERPAKNLYHTFTFGAYLVWALPDYPLFGDTRETPFKALGPIYKQAYASPLVARRLHQQYGIRTLMMPIPGTERIENVGYRDVLEEFVPRRDWALVYFDDLALVMVRRIPEHAAIVAAHEYKWIRPHIPPAHYAASAAWPDERRAAVRAEIDRCLQDRPAVRWCAAALREVSP